MSNCVFFALSQWWKKGGYIIIRKSKWGWWPHLLWSPDLKEFWEYQPQKPNHHLLIPPPLYRGMILTHSGDRNQGK